MAGSPTFFGDGHTPRRSDTSWIVLQKILGALVDGSSSGGIFGTTQVYIDRDPLPPDDPTKAAINGRSDGGSWTIWNPGTSAWV